MQRTPNVRHPGPDPAARAQHPRAPPTSRRRPEPRVLRLAPPSPVRALAVRAPRAALALPLQRPAGAAGRRRRPNPLMCLEISLNMDYLFKFENMDYLFRNYVVKYRLFVNLFNFDDK